MVIYRETVDFFKELHRRNSVFFYLGMGLTVLFGIFLFSFDNCQRSISEICHWLKPCKFTISFVVYVFSLGWYLEYLKDTLGERKIKIVTWLITAIILVEIAVILLQSWLTSQSYQRLHFPESTTMIWSRDLYLLANTIILSDAVVIAYVTFEFFRKIALKPEAYLWAVRAGFVTLILSSFLGIFLIERFGQVAPNTTSYALPFTRFSSQRDILVSLHFLGIHYLQILPFCCYFFQKYVGKKFILWSVGLYVVACLFFILMG